MREDRKRGKVKVGRVNSIVTGIDLGDRESLATVLSPIGDVTDGFRTTLQVQFDIGTLTPYESRLAGVCLAQTPGVGNGLKVQAPFSRQILLSPATRLKGLNWALCSCK